MPTRVDLPENVKEAECARCGDVFQFLNAGSVVMFDYWLERHGENCLEARQ